MNKLTIVQAAELAGVSRPTLYKYINDGTLSVVKDGKSKYIELSELLRVFPNASLQSNEQQEVNNLHALTTDLKHKDELIQMLKQQLNDKQKDNEFLKEQLTTVNQNFTQLNNLLENKTTKKKKFLGIF